jgi:hypothetical protein
MDISPYWKEEDDVSILADGYLGFVFDSSRLKTEPVDSNISCYQTFYNEFLGSAYAAVKTNIRLEYAGNIIKTFLWPSYCRETMKRIYDNALEKVMSLKDQLTDAPDLVSAEKFSRIVATKKYFLYIAAMKNSVCSLTGAVDFSHAKCGDRESILINSENIIADMSVCYSLGFWPVLLPSAIFQRQARFLSLPLGADPDLLARMGLFTGKVENRNE